MGIQNQPMAMPAKALRPTRTRSFMKLRVGPHAAQILTQMIDERAEGAVERRQPPQAHDLQAVLNIEAGDGCRVARRRSGPEPAQYPALESVRGASTRS